MCGWGGDGRRVGGRELSTHKSQFVFGRLKGGIGFCNPSGPQSPELAPNRPTVGPKDHLFATKQKKSFLKK